MEDPDAAGLPPGDPPDREGGRPDEAPLLPLRQQLPPPAPGPPSPNNNTATAAAAAAAGTPRIKIHWMKVAAVIVLLFICFLLRVCIYALEVTIAELRQQQQQPGTVVPITSTSSKRRRRSSNINNINNQQEHKQTQQPPIKQFTLRTNLHQYGELVSHHPPPPPTQQSSNNNNASLAQYYWNQVRAYRLLDWTWDNVDDEQDEDSSHSILGENPFPPPSLSGTSETHQGRALEALQRAADLGHAPAQFYMANALAAGFWTIATEQPKNKNNWTVADSVLIVSVEGDDNDHDDDDHDSTRVLQKNKHQHQQQKQKQQLQQQQAASWLLYRMAAQAGHIDAAMALVYRLDRASSPATQQPSDSTTASEHRLAFCQTRLPYVAAAAHGIIDELLLDPHSRGWVLPSTDRHTLHQVHLHGGTGSRLDADNRPDEASETLQFYHLRAQTLIQPSSNSNSNHRDEDVDAAAAVSAFTLARYYHLGLKGVTQNTTKAAYYYELAAAAGQWEAAGQAGMLHLFGIGVPPDSKAAHKWFTLGLGGRSESRNYESCKDRHQRRLKYQQNRATSGSGDKIYLCDDASLTGMGLLHLLGVPMITPVDRQLAQDYFTLAREQGNADAAYYLAMMKLGWMTHYRTVSDLNDDGQTSAKEIFLLEMNKKSDQPVGHPTPSEYQRILTDLTTAASKNHLLARHRLALLYEHGVTIPKTTTSGSGSGVKTKTTQVVPQDCQKALTHYLWVVDHGHRGTAQRMRRAYRHYVRGEYSHALRNYLVAAETGHGRAQANAAFLLEQGTCLGLSPRDCAVAAGRWWKATAKHAQHGPEASLRVGDLYYYGRFRRRNGNLEARKQGWWPFVVYPEQYLWPVVWQFVKQQLIAFSVWEPLSILESSFGPVKKTKPTETMTCDPVDDRSLSCVATTTKLIGYSTSSSSNDPNLERDLSLAVHYYRQAAEQGNNPRGHFNLGYMYEWGLGVKQDFPLAKREYDLALSHSSNNGVAQEADLPVTLALWALHVHETCVKLWHAWQAWNSGIHYHSKKNEPEAHNSPSPVSEGHDSPRRVENSHQVGRPVPGDNNGTSAAPKDRKSKTDVMLAHLFSWDSLLILMLTLLVAQLLKLRRRTLRR